MKIENIIRQRYSVRTYSSKQVDENLRTQIMEYAESIENPFGPDVRYKWLDKKQLPKGEKLGTYGIIQGTDLYLGTAVPEHENAMEALGYSFEKLVLHLTDMGLGTCWLGGTFNRKAFTEAMELKEGEIFCIVSPVGYPAEKKSLIEKMMRLGSKGDKRNGWEMHFFNGDFQTPLTKDDAGGYELPLEMVRLAPSAVNRQPWRIVMKDGAFHFFEKHTREDEVPAMIDMHRIDLGIAMCHFHMTVEELGSTGRFERMDVSDIEPAGNMSYIASWIVE